MKNKHLNVCWLQVFIIIASVLLFPVAANSQELTEEQKKERCQNNKNRIVELETQLRVIDADFSASMTKKEMEDKKTQMVFVTRVKNKVKGDIQRGGMEDINGGKILAVSNEDWKKYETISAQYNFKVNDCLPQKDKELDIDKRFLNCITELEKIIANKITKAKSLNRLTLLAKKNEIEKQLATHRNNLIALDCDNQARNPGGVCKLKGRWTQYTPGIGSTDWVIESDGTAKEKGIGYAEGKATLSGNVLHIDWQTKTGYSGYYEWTLDDNCTSVKGTLVFKTGRSDTINNSTVKWSPF